MDVISHSTTTPVSPHDFERMHLFLQFLPLIKISNGMDGVGREENLIYRTAGIVCGQNILLTAQMMLVCGIKVCYY